MVVKHVPNDTQRKQVEMLAIAGVDQNIIARIVGLGSKHTLEKHYREELDLAAAKAIMNNTVNLIKAANKGNTAAMIYFQKCRGGLMWQEHNNLALQGKIDMPSDYDEVKRKFNLLVARKAKELKED